MRCHGCHGILGGGAHSGSATGKNHCIFVHNPSCPGGVVEDANWKPCPDNYIFQGFDQTLSSQDFHTPSYFSQPFSSSMLGEGAGMVSGVPQVAGSQTHGSSGYATPSMTEDQVRHDRDRLQRHI